MRRAELLNQSERRTLDLLERSFLGRGFRVYTQVPLRRVVEKEAGEDLGLDHERMLRNGELDFIIVNRDAGYSVEFAFEFDGPYHQDPKQAARDRRKESLCLAAGVPLIRVPTHAIGEREQLTLLEWIIECFWIMRTDRKRVEEKREELEDRYERPVDLPLALHVMHPFPANQAVRKRLREKFGMSDDLEALIYKEDDAPLVLRDLNGVVHREEFDENPIEITADPAERPSEFVLGVMRFADHKFLYHTKAPIQWSPQNIISQAHAADRTGNWLWAVDLAHAEYIALTDIERWAERHLFPTRT